MISLSRLKARLAELADDFEFEVPARSAKSVFVDALAALAASHRFSYERIHDALSRDELKAIYRAGGLDDSGKVKAGVVDRILGRRDDIRQHRQTATRASWGRAARLEQAGSA